MWLGWVNAVNDAATSSTKVIVIFAWRLVNNDRMSGSTGRFMLRKYAVVALLSLSISVFSNASYVLPVFKPEMLEGIRSQYGDAALERVELWRDLLEEGKSESDWVRVNKVNKFFNDQIRYVSDQKHWGQNRYA